MFSKIFEKVEIIKAHVEFKLLAYRFVINTLTHCAIRNPFWLNIYVRSNLILLLILQFGGVPYHLKLREKQYGLLIYKKKHFKNYTTLALQISI